MVKVLLVVSLCLVVSVPFIIRFFKKQQEAKDKCDSKKCDGCKCKEE